jgi:2,3,4,5-tetrahydropyridine-2-carboxylate N-succinyltransferase
MDIQQSKPIPSNACVDEFDHHARSIEAAWDERASGRFDPAVNVLIDEVLEALDDGRLRAASRDDDGHWTANTWVMRAAVLSLRARGSRVVRAGELAYYDQPGKFHGMDDDAWRDAQWRVMSPTAVRRGSFLGKRVFLLPSFINVGVYIDDDTMIDGFANVGSCAQIGKRVHVSTCVGIGGVAEPMQPRPVIIEDDCFIGANSSVVEGVIVGEGSVIGMGVHLGASTKILDRETGRIDYGRVPPGSVVIPGSMPSPDGRYSTSCAVIVKRVDAATRAKVGVNELLRT